MQHGAAANPSESSQGFARFVEDRDFLHGHRLQVQKEKAVSLVVAAAEQNTIIPDSKGMRTLDGDVFPKPGWLKVQKPNQRKIGVVAKPNLFVGTCVESIAVSNAWQPLATSNVIVLKQGFALAVKADEARLAQAGFPKYALVKIAEPDSLTFRDLNILDTVSRMKRMERTAFQVEDRRILICFTVGSASDKKPLVPTKGLNAMKVLMGFMEIDMEPVSPTK